MAQNADSPFMKQVDPTRYNPAQPPGVAGPFLDPNATAGGIQAMPDASGGGPMGAPATPPPSGGQPWLGDPSMAGMNPELQKIYQSSGRTPAGRGTGFADWAYWNDKPSQFGRLQADIAGTGTDQPTGTPGSGPWQNSGKNQPMGGGAPGGGGMSPFMAGAIGQSLGPGIAGSPGSLSGAAGNLLNFETGRATGQITDASMPNLQIDPNDPIVKGQTEAYRTQATRQMQQRLSDLAAERGPNTNISAESRAANEALGTDVGAFQANAMANELGARRQEIAQALQAGTGLLTAEQQLQLTEEQTMIDKQLQEMGMQLQESQFGRSLAERGYEYDTTRGDTVYGGF